ncbi:single-stranded DNA-binding protein [bacterium]|nr:single-stranded DNA-binding protein [bacterium]
MGTTKKGTSLMKMSIVCSEYVKQGDQYKNIETYVDNIAVWGKYAESINSHLHEGMDVIIEGKLTSNEYEGKHYINIMAEKVEFIRSHESSPKSQTETDGDVPF